MVLIVVLEIVDLVLLFFIVLICVGLRLEYVRFDFVVSVWINVFGINVRKIWVLVKKEFVFRVLRVFKKYVGVFVVVVFEFLKFGGEGGDEVDKLVKDMKKIKIIVVFKVVCDVWEWE